MSVPKAVGLSTATKVGLGAAGAGLANAALSGGASGAGSTTGIEGADTEGIKTLDPSLAGTKPVVNTPGITAGDIGFGSMDSAGKFTAGLTGGEAIGTAPTLERGIVDRVVDKVTDPKEIAKNVGKEVVKDAISGGGSQSSRQNVLPWMLAAGAAGSMLNNKNETPSPSTPTADAMRARGGSRNPVVDIRRVTDATGKQMDELFINNRRTGRRGFAAGGDVNLDAYDFFKSAD
jgi:hypothetical protein